MCKSGKKFDLITINYVLSVADNAGKILDCVKGILSKRGILFIIDTSFEMQPYILNIVESSSFLTQKSLQNILIRKGYKELLTDFSHEKKEIWAFATVNEQKVCRYQNLYKENRYIYDRGVDYLNSVIDVVENKCKHNDKLAIWGMSNAGIWLAEIIKGLGIAGKQVTWIEEDEDILQKSYGVNGYPIRRIEAIDFDTVVFLPFPHYVTLDIVSRNSEFKEKMEFVCFE